MRYREVVVLNPPNPSGYTSNKDSMGGFGQLYPAGAPPAPILDQPYLAAFLRDAGVPVQVIDAGALDLTAADVCDRLRQASDALVVVRTSLPTIDWDLSVCAQIRERTPVAGVALTGAIVKPLMRRIEQDETLDFAICGEPDGPVFDLATGKDLHDIDGLTFRDADGAWRSNAERSFERDLDALPFPAWDLFPHERYIIPRSSNAGKMRFLPMLTSRGCPFGCNYCPYPVGQGLRWRFRSPANVVDEMEHLVREFGTEYILFRDPIFSLRKDRVVEICQEIERRGLRVRWRCETRVDCLDEATVAAMASAGCSGINFGVESTDPDIQQGNHRRPISTDDFRRIVATCKEHGIQTFAFFIVGLPGDTEETILDSIRFAVEIQADWTQFTVSTPFIGTRLHEWAVSRGLIEEDFYRIISSHEGSVGNENLSPAQIQQLHRFARFLQNNLINRRGILKNASRPGVAYRAARWIVDRACHGVAVTAVEIVRWYVMRTRGPAATASPH